MKTGKVTALVSYLFSSLSFPVLLLILFSLSLTSSSSSVSYKHDNLFVSTYDFMVVIRKSSGVPLFFMLSFIIITVSLGSGSSNSSSGDDLDRYFPPFPLVSHEINTAMIIINQEHENYDEEDNEDGYDIEDCYNHGFPLVSHEINTAMVIINQERENYDDSGSTPDDEEDIDDGVEDIEDCYNHGYDGSEEDNEDGFGIESTEDENDDKDLERRTEEFIAKVNQKWREEWLADRLLCLPAP